ncbi:hypothetical protein PFISCL1PPCAC_1886, partial [Pristionchus fissidentatus]
CRLLYFQTRMLKIGLLLLCYAVYMAHSFTDDTCAMCTNSGTYKCEDGRCECHVNFKGDMCNKQMEFCPDSECSNQGTCSFDRGTFKCFCHEGFFGRRCEHTESEVKHVYEMEKDLELKNCGAGQICKPPVPEVVCSTTDLNNCDENGIVRPVKPCPYPHYCWEKFNNNKCDWECNRSECYYDSFECSTRRPCPSMCRTKSGGCSSECSLRMWATNETIRGPIQRPVLIKVTLAVSEQFWWDNMREIVSNISEPLRTPLIYVASQNERLEKNKYSLENVISRGKRNIMNEKENNVDVTFVMPIACKHSEECVRSAEEAGAMLSLASTKSTLGVPKFNHIEVGEMKDSRLNSVISGRDIFRSFFARLWNPLG